MNVYEWILTEMTDLYRREFWADMDATEWIWMIYTTRVQVGLRKSDPIARPRHCTTKKKVALREMCRSWPRVMHDPLLSTPCAMHDPGSSFEDPKRPVVHV